MLVLLSLLIGVVAGMRAMLAPAAVSWGAYLGIVPVAGWLGWLGHWLTPWILTLAAVAELVSDKRANTPSRTVPPQFAARLISGAISGAALGMAGPGWPAGLVVGTLGALAGTYCGAAARRAVARSLGRDLPAALIEDAAALALAAATVAALA